MKIEFKEKNTEDKPNWKSDDEINYKINKKFRKEVS